MTVLLEVLGTIIGLMLLVFALFAWGMAEDAEDRAAEAHKRVLKRRG